VPDQVAEAETQQARAQDDRANEKFQGHAIQRGWLDRAKGKVVQVRFLDGKGVKGELVGHDNYCLSVKLEAAPEPVLIFKHAIAYLARVRVGDSSDGAL
jgi:sRNA-binding regulator protein Hfq